VRSSALGLSIGLTVMAGCGMSDTEPTDTADPTAAKFHRSAEPIRDRYIVMLAPPTDASAVGLRSAPTVEDFAADLGALYDAEVRTTWPAVRGFAATMSERDAIALADEPGVAMVSEDGVVRAVATQSPATWGIDRVDQRERPLDNSYTYLTDASGVTAYVIDTGIRITHAELGGRARHGFSASGGTADDCNGHGTHVAGTIGGATYGIAKGVQLVAVRVLDCGGSGTSEGVISGIDWVTANHTGPSVANMSLGGSANPAINAAVAVSVDSGVTYAVAAGNESTDACGRSPASEPSAITVGATTSTDTRSTFSNFGTCVDVFAPGSDITSAWIDSDTAIRTISGTSMATPHVAGVAALYLAGNPIASPAQVAAAIVDGATPGSVADPGTGSPDLLLFSRLSSEPPPVTEPPTVTLTSPAGGSTVGGTVAVTATAADPDGSVARVRFALPGVGVVDDTTAPYEASWDTSTLPNGPHTVRVRAIDDLGAVSEAATATVTVYNDPCDQRLTAPTGTLQSPNFPGDYPDDLDFTWCITPPGGDEATLTFTAEDIEPNVDLLDVVDGNTGRRFGSRPAISSFLMIRFTTGRRSGSRTGWQASWTSAPHNVVPTVALTNPRPGGLQTGTVAVTADAADADGTIAFVRFQLPGNVFVDDTSAPYSIPWDTTTLADGWYLMSAQATDNRGRASELALVFFPVSNPVLPPVGCDETLTASGGTLQSPSFPAPYPNNFARTWCIRPVDGAPATLTFPSFDIEASFDFVRITDGITGQLLSSTSGTTAPPPATSSFLKVRFTTDSSVTRPGWQAAWTTATAPPPNQAPTVALVAPAGGSTVRGTVAITATAADSDGTIAAVVFEVPGLGTVRDTQAPYEVAWNTRTVGNQSYPIRVHAVDDDGAPSAVFTAAVTVSNPALSGVTMRARNEVTSARTGSIEPTMSLVNASAEALALGRVEIRYWYTADGTQAERAVVDWAGLMPQGTTITPHVQSAIVPVAQGSQDRYLRVRFGAQAGSLAQRQAIQVQSRLHKLDWSEYTQGTDHSFTGSAAFIEWDHITVYVDGALVWGVEPGDQSSADQQSTTPRLQPHSMPSP
jgi:subtilisin family serine protease